ncbi:hypothetical protein HN450_02175 [bacterium]|jgi:hypothetical protein|nr:hypothetical protein [bacterium]MBT3849838.1 hypothetical protein [bacterium]MBT4434973.1 hypothetical protein [bacterium]MDG2445648.1 hypothetical protein [Thermodesulfobacteriota bacterium]NSW99839.1 hypothetical protein [bacterium]|tara:strand:+ start:257 stop:856 length:600 start_codon:yes stop_codon:yes gene_type:complete
MSIFKTLGIFVAVLFISSTFFSYAKEVQETDYSSDEVSTKTEEVKAKEVKKFDYNKTYGPSPVFTIGGGFSASPGGWAVSTRLDLPFKDDLYIGPVVQYADGDDETLMGVTGNIKKILPSTDAKVVPSVEAGLGVLVDDKKNDNDDNSSSLLTVLGAGFDYILSDNLSVGAHAYLNNSFDMDHKEFFFTALVGLNIRLY